MINIMEVCGTHTAAIARAGIKSLLPEDVQLLSGPGCPVCVTPPEVIDEFLKLSDDHSLTIATYGDLLRIPGSHQGDNLRAHAVKGAKIEIVYSPMDAAKFAQKHPDREVIFLGAGFETTAPGTAATIEAAYNAGLKNFTVFSMMKKVEPSLRALMEQPDFNVKGFLVPGHVAVIIGEKGFRFLEDYKMPGVIAGFESNEILEAVNRLIEKVRTEDYRLENNYQRIVFPEGNVLAQNILEEFFEVRTDIWRGLGEIPASGFKISEKYKAFDAEVKFGITYKKAEDNPACHCGDIICGRMSPMDCPLFGTVCVPYDPVGPCMVSGEGACASAYKYKR